MPPSLKESGVTLSIPITSVRWPIGREYFPQIKDFEECNRDLARNGFGFAGGTGRRIIRWGAGHYDPFRLIAVNHLFFKQSIR